VSYGSTNLRADTPCPTNMDSPSQRSQHAELTFPIQWVSGQAKILKQLSNIIRIESFLRFTVTYNQSYQVMSTFYYAKSYS